MKRSKELKRNKGRLFFLLMFLSVVLIVKTLQPTIVRALEQVTGNRDLCSLVTASEGHDQTIACNSEPIDFVNSSFEDPQVGSSRLLINQSDVPGWNTTQGDGAIELWDKAQYNDLVGSGGFPDGNQGLELNVNFSAALYQDFTTIPGQKIYYSFYHGGRQAASEHMSLYIGTPTTFAANDTTPTVGGESDFVIDDYVAAGEWHRITGDYTVPDGQTTSRIAFSSNDPGSVGNLIDDVVFTTKPLYDNILSISDTTAPTEVTDGSSNTTYLSDVFTVSDEIKHLEGDYFKNGSITFEFNSPVEVVGASIQQNGGSTNNIPAAQLPDYITGNGTSTITFNNLDGLASGKAENIVVNLNVKPVGDIDPDSLSTYPDYTYELEATSEFNYSPVVANDTAADRYYVKDKATPLTKTYKYELGVDKTANVSSVKLGDTIDYSIKVNNTGTLPQDNVVVTDNLVDADLDSSQNYDATNLSIVDSSGNPVTTGISGDLKTGLTISNIPNFNYYTINFSVPTASKFDNSEYIENTATVTSDGLKSSIDSNVNIEKEEVNPQETMTKMAEPATGMKAGDTITYKISVGPLTEKAANITVKDPLDSQYLELSSEPNLQVMKNDTPLKEGITDNSSKEGGVDVNIYSAFEEGDKVEVDFAVKVSDDTPEKTSIINTATSSVDGTQNTADKTITTDLEVREGQITKTVEDTEEPLGLITPGEEVNYNILVENTSSRIDLDVTLTDDITSQLSSVFEIIDTDEVLINSSADELEQPDPITMANLTTGVDINIPKKDILGKSTIEFSFKLKAKDQIDKEITEITNEACITGEVDSCSSASMDVRPESDPQEDITKEVVNKKDLYAGDNLRYKITVGELKEIAHEINIVDPLEDEYLSLAEDPNVSILLNGEDITTLENYEIVYGNEEEGFSADILGEFAEGDIIEVEFDAQVLEGAPENKTLINKATSFVDGTENTATYKVVTAEYPREGKITHKIRKTSDNSLLLEEEDQATFTIEVVNGSEKVDLIETVKSDILANLESIFIIDENTEITAEANMENSVFPESSTIADLKDGIDIDLAPSTEDEVSNVVFEFTAAVNDVTTKTQKESKVCMEGDVADCTSVIVKVNKDEEVLVKDKEINTIEEVNIVEKVEEVLVETGKGIVNIILILVGMNILLGYTYYKSRK